MVRCGIGSKHVLNRGLESALSVSARVESERTGLLDKAVPCTVEADGTAVNLLPTSSS
jgi:hypothetical protein